MSLTDEDKQWIRGQLEQMEERLWGRWDEFAELLEVSFDPATRTARDVARQAWDRNEVHPLV